MRRVCLLFNPAAGRRRDQRFAIVERVASAIRDSGVAVETIATRGPGTAGSQARDACARGADIVFACGGDGTVHDVLQGLVFQPRTSLGVIPLGSANALAHHLRLPRDPVMAAMLQLKWEGRLLPVGQVTYTSDAGKQSRYFTVMAGAGADGTLVYRMLSSSKERFGRVSYYVRAVGIALRHSFPQLELQTPKEKCDAVSVMAVRVADLGGAFSPMVRGGLLSAPELRVAAAYGSPRLALGAWFALSWLHLSRLHRHVRFLHVASCAVGAVDPEETVYVQADGEWLGRTPMAIAVVPGAVRLLAPPGVI